MNSCANLLSVGKMSPELFAKELLEPVISLVSDPISNVRVAVAKILKQVIIANGRLMCCFMLCVLCVCMCVCMCVCVCRVYCMFVCM